MIYEIQKGKHYSNFKLPRFHFGAKRMSFKFILTESCDYPVKGEDFYDVNKISGLSWGYHHKNSFRIGYNAIGDGKFTIYTYYYNNGDRYIYPLFDTEIGKCVIVHLEFDYSNNRIIYIIGKSDIVIHDTIPFKFPFIKAGYYLYPYHGGNIPAQQLTKIILEQTC